MMQRCSHTSVSKVEAIVKVPAPKNIAELRSFLGMVNYYGIFIPNVASKLHPLHSLLETGVSETGQKSVPKFSHR